MDAVGKRNNNQYAGAKTTTHFDGSPTQAQGEGRRFRKKVRHKNNAGCAYEDRQGRKVDWQAVAPFFKRIFPRPPAEAWGSGLRVADNQVSDPIWVGTDKECVTKNEYGQILQYLQNKCNIYDLELSRPDEGHDSFINSITEEIVAVSLRSLSDATPRSSRATKLLINFGNNAAWVVFDRVGPGVPKLEEQNHPAQLCISSYVALSPSEYEYILNLFQYVALARGAVPISAVPIIGKLEEPEESQALDGTEDTEDTISLGGFVWQKSPRALASAPGASGPSSAAVLEGLLDRYSLRCAVQTDEAMPDLGEDDSFTGRQIISSLYELMAVETELHEMRERILSQMCVENIYPYRLSHEPRIAQFITAKARASQRWSQFRRTIIAAVNHYACQMLEARRNAPETAAPPEADAVLGSEYCSVCLMAEQAHKHVLMQCRRCRVRVHHQCYASISQGPPVDGGPWLCDVCSEEGGRGDSYVSNRGICAICGSSGGAMKRVDGEAAVYFTQFYAAQYGGACGNDGKTPGACWIHIICGAWLIPSVNCKDWLTLSNWDITNLRTSPKNNRCAVCMAALGFYVSCRIPQCGVKMHPLCAWLGGVFVTVKFVYSKSLPFNNAADNCFTPFQIEPLCPFHSCKEFSQEVVKKQSKERCLAYLHYVMNPNPFNKHRQAAKPLVLSPSPVMVTLNGPVISPGAMMQAPMPMYPIQSPYMHGPSAAPMRTAVQAGRGRVMFLPPRVDHSMSYRDFLASQQVPLQPKSPRVNHQPLPLGSMRYLAPSHVAGASKGRAALLHLDSLRPSVCAVCYEESNDPTLQCTRCGTYVHHRCYISREAPVGGSDVQDGFLCVVCRTGIEDPECAICKCRGGAMVLAVPGDRLLAQPMFAHPCCGVFAGLAVSTDASTGFHHFCGIDKLAGTGGVCGICDTVGGLVVRCNQQGCERRFHVSCGKRSGCFIEIKRDGHYAFCIQHTQARSAISSRLRMYLKLLAFVEIANIALDAQAQ